MTTIIHEALHAQLTQWLREAVINGDTSRQHQLAALYGSVFTPDFSNLGSVYNTVLQETTQHDAIASSYKSILAQSLKIFAQSKNINLNTSNNERLAWAGLNNSTAFRKLSLTDQTFITNMINAEKDPYGFTINGNNGNPQEAAIGHPCN